MSFDSLLTIYFRIPSLLLQNIVICETFFDLHNILLPFNYSSLNTYIKQWITCPDTVIINRFESKDFFNNTTIKQTMIFFKQKHLYLVQNTTIYYLKWKDHHLICSFGDIDASLRYKSLTRVERIQITNTYLQRYPNLITSLHQKAFNKRPNN